MLLFSSIILMFLLCIPRFGNIVLFTVLPIKLF